MLTFGTYTRRYVLPLWPWYLGGMVLLAIVNSINLYIPQFAKEIINRFTSGASLDETSTIALSIVGLGFLLILTRTLSRILIFWPGRKIETETKYDLFAKLLQLPEDFFTKFGLGDLISRLSNDTGQLRAFFAFGMLQILNVLFLCVMTLWMMAKTNLLLTVLTVAPLLLMLVITRFAMPRMQESSREQQKAVGELTSHVTESFVNVHVIQANSAEGSFINKVAQSNHLVYDTNIRILWIRTMIFPLMSCLAGFSQLAVLLYGGFLVSQNQLTVGDILAFNVYIGLLTFPLTAMGIIIAVYQRAKTALERLTAIDSAAIEGPREGVVSVSASTSTPPTLLEVRDLNFAYPDRPPSLQGINLTLTAGKVIGIFGKVGSGKTTLFHLMTRLYDPEPGRISFKGRDILSIDPRSLRASMGYALQGVHLFSASLKENLAFGLDPAPSLDELTKAAQAASIMDDINAFAQGWDTEIGEKGVRLSGGQKQRLALARLILRKPEVLLLDDVLSAVDHVTEQTILKNLFNLKIPMILASHRPSTLRRCDEVIVLGAGKVLDRGDFTSISATFSELSRDQQTSH